MANWSMMKRSILIGSLSSLNFALQLGSKLAVANGQIATDLRLFAPKISDLKENLRFKFLKLILAWSLKSLISFLTVNLCLKGSSLEA